MDTTTTSSLTAESAAAILDLISAIEPATPAESTTSKKKVAVVKAAKLISYPEIREKVRTVRGQTFGGQVVKGASAELLPGQYVRIFGTYYNRHVPKDYDLRFVVGAKAVYDSYNMVYVGTVEAIGEKTIAIRSGAQLKRIDLAEFVELNWNFDEARINKKNAEWMD